MSLPQQLGHPEEHELELAADGRGTEYAIYEEALVEGASDFATKTGRRSKYGKRAAGGFTVVKGAALQQLQMQVQRSMLATADNPRLASSS